MGLFDAFRTSTIEDLSSQIPLAELKRRVKIVVVDDESDSFPTEALRDAGYTIDWWTHVDAAKLHRLETGAFDIVVLDIQGIASPQLSDTGDGLGILKRIKDVNPNQVVVAFSGKTYDLTAMPFYRLADESMGKPVSLIQCKEVLDHLIEERVSVPQYWYSIQSLLRREGVEEKKIRKFEHLLVRKAKRDEPITMDDIKRAIGHVESAATIVSLGQQIATLCHLLIA